MSSNSNSNYSPRPDWRTERNLLQNFNQVSNKKLKTISLANALKQMKMKNDRALKKMKMENNRVRKEYGKKLKEMKTLREKTMKQLKDKMRLKQLKEEKKNKTNNSKPIPEPNYLPRPLGWRKTKEINKKVEKSKSLKAIESSLRENSSEYDWIKFNRERLEGEFVTIPEREQIPENIKEQLIVELYSK